MATGTPNPAEEATVFGPHEGAQGKIHNKAHQTRKVKSLKEKQPRSVTGNKAKSAERQKTTISSSTAMTRPTVLGKTKGGPPRGKRPGSPKGRKTNSGTHPTPRGPTSKRRRRKKKNPEPTQK